MISGIVLKAQSFSGSLDEGAARRNDMRCVTAGVLVMEGMII